MGGGLGHSARNAGIVNLVNPGIGLASERLALSREKLILAVRANQASASSNSAAPDWLTEMESLKHLPVVGVALAALRAWWPQQPMRLAGATASIAATAVLGPLAQRYPLSFALGGVVIGALLVKVKPWRWIPITAILSGLAPKAMGNLLRTASVQNWLVRFATDLATQKQRQPPA